MRDQYSSLNIQSLPALHSFLLLLLYYIEQLDFSPAFMMDERLDADLPGFQITRANLHVQRDK